MEHYDHKDYMVGGNDLLAGWAVVLLVNVSLILACV